MKATVLRTSIIFAGLFVFSGFGLPAQAAVKFEMVVTGKSPYPLLDRKDLSLNTGGGKGVLISPRWAMTASHCITSRKQKAGKVTVIFPGPKGKKIKVKVTKVLRHKSKDIALLQLARAVKPAERMPVLLLRETAQCHRLESRGTTRTSSEGAELEFGGHTPGVIPVRSEIRDEPQFMLWFW